MYGIPKFSVSLICIHSRHPLLMRSKELSSRQLASRWCEGDSAGLPERLISEKKFFQKVVSRQCGGQMNPCQTAPFAWPCQSSGAWERISWTSKWPTKRIFREKEKKSVFFQKKAIHLPNDKTKQIILVFS